jgi:hypothetical protein
MLVLLASLIGLLAFETSPTLRRESNWLLESPVERLALPPDFWLIWGLGETIPPAEAGTPCVCTEEPG